MYRPQQRAVKLWLPSDADKDDTRDDSKGSKSPAAASTDAQDEPDEDLDKLLAQYEQQAEADKRRVTDTAARPKPTSQMGMKELRETGLAQPLSSDTKGFQLLAKMGYKAGEGIGKEGKGRAAPITVDLKASRTGLGVDEDRKRKQESYKQLQELKNSKRQKGQEILKDSYLTHQAASFADRQAEQHLKEAQKVCETLDRRRGMTENHMWLVEPPLVEGGDDEEPDEDAAAAPVNPWAELPIAEQLQDVLDRLRSEHSYCIFCGCQYADSAELTALCPGPQEGDH
ncbi:hypothetical protein CVIRNUC_005873 [Coccomyxa viridis]|uniref:G-patch domain-containing protein n=1 Tax=Coccomyxa viridis TaxID=1274662 RepID=A0AAV1I680_9CHLO|nr:hypothetical protein CVIRNUC_005873 [Coccomyxa viridis]